MAGPASIIGAVAVRIARLASTGLPDYNNASGRFMLCGGISTFEHNFEVESGADLFVRDAGGNACVVRRRPDATKYATFTLTMCRADYRLYEILGVSNAVTLGGTVVGHAVKTSVGCGSVAAPNGVSIELWSEQWDCDVPLSNQPYQRAILPRCYLVPSGFTREDGVSLPKFTGFSVANNNWGDGPWGDAEVLAAQTGWCYAEIDDVAVPSCVSPVGYINVPGSAS